MATRRADPFQTPASVYQVFVRNYTEKGTLNALKDDLGRIKAMGFDWIYLLPIHPVGKQGRKGSLGSPYSIADYYAIDPSLGTMDDFHDLIHSAHAKGMHVMMDMVFHHSARDCLWVKEHPEYYHWKDGKLQNAVEDWSDVADLNFDEPALNEELLHVLRFWQKQGIDGIRCDVASLVPLSFWLRARRMLKSYNKDFKMLAETVEGSFTAYMRSKGYQAMSDGEAAQAFDWLYPYSIRDEIYGALENGSLLPYEKMLNFEMISLPAQTREILFLENHDRPRAASVLKGRKKKEINWTAFSLLMLGTGFVYAGQEAWEFHQPSLFDPDPVLFAKRDPQFEQLISDLNRLRTQTLSKVLSARLLTNPDVLEFAEYKEQGIYYGAFDVNACSDYSLHLKDGSYHDILADRDICIRNGRADVQLPLLIDTDLSNLKADDAL